MRIFIILTVSVVCVLPLAAFAQQASQSTAPIPDFSRIWTRSGFPWFEPPASGPGPVTNKSRWPYIVNQRLGGSPGGSPGLPPRGKFLQLHLTIEDEGVFTTPWTATITYVPGPDTWSEVVCAENTHQYYYNNEADVPRAEKPDF